MTGCEAPRRLPILAKLNLAALAILAGALVVHLWPAWNADPDLSQGLLMPAVCAFLLYLSRRSGTERFLAEGPAFALASGLGSAALAGLCLAGLLAVTVDWGSAIVTFCLTSSFALLGCACLCAFSGRDSRLVPLNWTALSAALLWPLCSPLPPGTYSRITLGLQLWVSANVMRVLDLLGIAAHRQGNIIELARGTVGIEEACSGVRSLVACIFAGVLFSATLARRPWARVSLIGLSVPLALAMNFLRSLLLTLLVNAGVRVEGLWHDATGYLVLVVTAALLLSLAISLEARDAGVRPAPAPGQDAAGSASGRFHSQRALSLVLGLALALLAFFAGHTRPSTGLLGPVPDLAAMLPPPVSGWRVENRPDLYQFAGILRTDHLAQRTFYRKDAQGTEQVTFYLAFWPEGQATAGVVGSHTPDACWPGTGWAPVEGPPGPSILVVQGHPLPQAQYRLFVNEGYPQYVWFWQIMDGHVVDVGSTRSVSSLVRIALRFGFRKTGQQAFVRISSNRTWGEISKEPFVVDFFARAQRLGLY